MKTTLYDLEFGDTFEMDGTPRKVVLVRKTRENRDGPAATLIVCDDAASMWGPDRNMKQVVVERISRCDTPGLFYNYSKLPGGLYKRGDH